MSGFTPGPWHIKSGTTPGFKTGTGGPGIYADARPSDDFFILQIAVLETNVPAEEIEANAHLFATAPDLLKALIKARNTLAGLGYAHFAADICDAAIAQATGSAT